MIIAVHTVSMQGKKVAEVQHSRKAGGDRFTVFEGGRATATFMTLEDATAHALFSAGVRAALKMNAKETMEQGDPAVMAGTVNDVARQSKDFRAELMVALAWIWEPSNDTTDPSA